MLNEQMEERRAVQVDEQILELEAVLEGSRKALAHLEDRLHVVLRETDPKTETKVSEVDAALVPLAHRLRSIYQGFVVHRRAIDEIRERLEV